MRFLRRNLSPLEVLCFRAVEVGKRYRRFINEMTLLPRDIDQLNTDFLFAAAMATNEKDREDAAKLYEQLREMFGDIETMVAGARAAMKERREDEDR